MKTALLLLACGIGCGNLAAAATRSVSHTEWIIASEQVTLRVILPVEEVNDTVAAGQPSPSNETLGAYVLRQVGVSRQGASCEAIDQGYDIGRINTLAAGPGLRGFEIIFHCLSPGRPVLTNNLLFERRPRHIDYAQIEEDGSSVSHLFTAQRRQLDLAVHDASEPIGTYVALGAGHIAHSLERVCFFLGLLLLARHLRDWLIAASGLAIGYGMSLAIPLLHLVPNMPSVDSALGLLVALCALQRMALRENSPARVAATATTILTLLGAATWRLNREVAWMLWGSGVFSGSLLMGASRRQALLLAFLPLLFGTLDGLGLWGDFSRLHLWRELSPAAQLCFNIGSLLADLGIMASLYAAKVGWQRLRRARDLETITADLAATALAGLGSFWVLAQLKI